jgi:hypothetical protein
MRVADERHDAHSAPSQRKLLMDSTTQTPSSSSGLFAKDPSSDHGQAVRASSKPDATLRTGDDATAASPVQHLFKRVVDGAHDTVDGAAAKVAPVVDGIAKVSDTRSEWVGAARDVIREHPFTAIAGALLVGAAYISLTGSRR